MIDRESMAELTLVDRLFERLDDERAEYCHWKSNIGLEDALAGHGDLDLLVGRGSLARTLAVLAELGFKRAVDAAAASTPGTIHLYGLDPRSGSLIHVHVYTMLLSGESHVKSHRFPFETMLLETRVQKGRVQVASPSAEVLVHVLRSYVKFGSVFDGMLSPHKVEAARGELLWLERNADPGEVLTLLRRYCPVVEEELFLACLRALRKPAPMTTRLLLAARIRRRLRVHARHAPPARLWANARYLAHRALARLTGLKRRRGLESGGAVVAFVGGDATGKSTLVRETGCWLGKALAVRTAHAGKPPASWLSAPFVVARFVLHRVGPDRTHETEKPEPAHPPAAPSVARALRAVLLAWDRRKLLVEVRRRSAHGEIVVCDRYPSDRTGAMDSRRLRELPDARGIKRRIHNRLARLEARLYAQIPPPDVVIRVRVSLETARRRNGARREQDADAYLRARHRENGTWSRAGTRTVEDLENDGPLEEAMLRVKRLLWPSL